MQITELMRKESIMSKFDSCSFYGGYDDFAVSKEKYTKEEAITLYRNEKSYCKGKDVLIAVCDAYVRHRAGINEDGEPCVGWWLEYKEHKRSCPVWAFHLTPNKEEKFFKGYEYIKLTI